MLIDLENIRCYLSYACSRVNWWVLIFVTVGYFSFYTRQCVRYMRPSLYALVVRQLATYYVSYRSTCVFAGLLAMAQLIYFENRGLAEIIRMLMTLADIEVSSSLVLHVLPPIYRHNYAVLCKE